MMKKSFKTTIMAIATAVMVAVLPASTAFAAGEANLYTSTTQGTVIPSSLIGLDSITLQFGSSADDSYSLPLSDAGFQDIYDYWATPDYALTAVTDRMKQPLQDLIMNYQIMYLVAGFDSTSATLYTTRYFQTYEAGLVAAYTALTGTAPTAAQAPVAALLNATVNSTGFNAYYYYTNYPDLQASIGAKPVALYNHYVTDGQAEGRVATTLLP